MQCRYFFFNCAPKVIWDKYRMADIHPRNKNVANTDKLYEFLTIDLLI